MATFYQSFLEALGWLLVDSLWKMGGVWLFYILLTGNEKWFSAAKRYVLAVLMMIAGTVWSFSCAGTYYHNLLSGKEVSALSQYFKTGPHIFPFISALLPAFSTVYMALVIFFSIRWIGQYRYDTIAITRNVQEPDASIHQLFIRLVQKMGIRRKISFWLSDSAVGPLTIGFFKPIILLPVAALNQLTPEQTEAVIAHELFHVRRNDYLINIFLSFLEMILFFNPFSRLFRRVIQKEREQACDDEVVAMGMDRWQYAHALFALGKLHSLAYASALAATGTKTLLLDRVRRITNNNARRRSGKAEDRFKVTFFKPLAIFFLCLGFSVLFRETKKTNVQPAVVSGAQRTVSGNKRAVPDEISGTIESIKKHPDAVQKPVKKTGKKGATDLAGAEKHPPGLPDIPKPPAPPDGVTIVNSFVAAHRENAEFTLVIPEAPVSPSLAEGLQKPIPYVPSSTFYYSNVEDSLNKSDKKVIDL